MPAEWQAVAWIAGLAVLYVTFRVACWMSDRHIAEWTNAVDDHAERVSAMYGEDLSTLDRLDGVGSRR